MRRSRTSPSDGMPRRPTAEPPTAERLQSLVRAFRGRRVAVLGDLLADEFIYGRVERVSREAPVLILRYDQTDRRAGRRRQRRQQRRGARRAAAALAARVGQRRRRTPAGREPSARREPRRLVRAARLPRRRSRRGSSPAASTRRSSRSCGSIASGRPRPTRRRRARLSRPRAARSRAPTRCWCPTTAPASSRRRWSRRCAAIWRAPRAERRVPILVDSRHETLRYRGADGLHAERVGSRAAARRLHRRRRGRRSSGPDGRVLKRTGMEAVLITRGSRGMALFEPGAPTAHIADLRLRRSRRRHRRGRHRHRDADAGARRRRVVLRGRAAGELRRRARRHEARHRDRLAGGARVGDPPRRRRADADGRFSRAMNSSGCVAARSRGRPNDRVCQRRASICCTSATCATCRRRRSDADRLVVAVNADASVRRLKGAGAADSRRARSRRAGRRASRRRLRRDLRRRHRGRRCSRG